MCNLFKTVFSFLVLQKDNSLSGSFGRISQERKFMNFSDSLSALQALGKLKTDHPLPKHIQKLLHKSNADQNEIVFMWVPGHVGIRGNEAADRAAKEALDKKVDSRTHAFFGPKTFHCQICVSNLAERMG